MGCLISGRYTMLADFASQTKVRNEAGQIIRTWDFENPYTVRNLTVGILGGGIRVVGSTESWGEDYEEIEWAKMYISSQVIAKEDGNEVFVNRRFRVKNIRDEKSGAVLWVGDDEDRDPIEFMVMGITPIIDPFGSPVEYEILLKGVTGD